MKRANKYLSLALALIMALSLCVTSFAATITVTNAQKGETYDAYKIFDVTKSGESNYAYSILDTDAWFNVVVKFMTGADAVADQAVFTGKGLTLTKTATNEHMYVLTVDNAVFNTAKAAEFAAFLAENIAKEEDGTATATVDGSLTINVDKAGYYFVDTTLGALCALLTNEENVDLVEKNVEPTLDKNIVIVNETETLVKSTTASINDVITYEIKVTNGKNTDKAITVHDTMEDGLTLNANSFKVNGVAIADVENVTLNADPADDCTFEIVFNETFVKALDNDAVVTIRYTATVNEEVEIATETNDNTAWLTYSQQTSAPAKVEVLSYEFDLVKTTNENVLLEGATFRLYNAETAGEEIEVVAVEGETGVYRVATAEETGVAIEAGKVTIQGLGNGTYYLEETAAPAGYNMLTTRKAVTIENANNNAIMNEDGTTYVNGGVQVINQSGAILPSTGGVGTTMFYVLGSVMMIGAAVLLVTKKKMANEQ
ncbi:MAG: isopeptide-forming domain-containing fimbrial protein [Clostridia bacterium]|nr:isopeptide-forming domain-containing fimbrial protein [Clostridia bacterium]